MRSQRRPPWGAETWAQMWSGKDQSLEEEESFPDRNSKCKWLEVPVTSQGQQSTSVFCCQSRIRWVQRRAIGDVSGFFPFHLTKTFSKLIHWIKGREERKGIGQYNFDVQELIPAKANWGTKTSTLGASLSLGLSFNFFSPRSGSDGHPTSRLSSYLFTHPQRKWEPLPIID